ncbi:MAG TPA: prolyl oligopeptidase family serine peptidase [Steroidobacteraceae bacterium]|nr:prolyl oligopeptidase family serine peptidase [Steroidobacteraceae bacterium]
MGRYRWPRRTALATALVGLLAGLLAGCAGYTIGRPTPVPGTGPHGMPQPTATQIAAGANPNPRGPQMNPFVAELRPPGAPAAANPYAWLQDVRSSKTRHWILVEARATRKALAAIPQRAWIVSRLRQLQGGGIRAASSDVVVTHILYLTPDGVRLPMEVAHRRGLALDGNRPTLLSVYHSTGKPVARLLQPFVLVWLEMGGVYARAEVRNGLAKVPAPQGGGKVPDRSIALGDLFSAAQSLIDDHYTRRARLGIHGRGFGGLMAGAAVTVRPEFFGAALPTGTWREYRRIASGDCFPPTLIVTAEHDGDFRPWRGYELAAALQAEQLCGHPILLRVESDEGAGAPAAQRRERMADELAFAARWLGARAPGSAP